MIAPPRTAELLLASLGAEAEFRDAVIGDLAEEFAQHAADDGFRAARRWYYREALRALPHLGYSGLRRFGVKGLWHRLGVVLSAYTIMLMAALVPLAIVASLLVRLGVPIPWNHPATSTPLLIAILAADVVMATFGGYVAAYLDTEAPLLGATMFGATWVTVVLLSGVARVVVHADPPEFLVPLVFRFLAFLLIVGCPIIGGVLRVRARESNSAELAVD